MGQSISNFCVFIDGAARFKDLIYLIAKDRGLAEQHIEHSRFIAFDRSEFCHMGDRNWSAVAVSVAKQPSEKMIAVGEDGDVFTYVGGTSTDEIIDPRPVCLRSVNVVDGFAIACGMKREVYLRTNENTWIAMHAPTPAQNESAGFEAICGFSMNEIYATGWNGEIWQWSGSIWLQHANLTNLILTGMCCDNEDVCICGQEGTLIRGRKDHWELIDMPSVTEDFWDICWFDGKLYLATMTMLYMFDGKNIELVDFGTDRPSTCYRLSVAEDVLWSTGSDDVFCFDGEIWTRVD